MKKRYEKAKVEFVNIDGEAMLTKLSMPTTGGNIDTDGDFGIKQRPQSFPDAYAREDEDVEFDVNISSSDGLELWHK